MQALKKLRLVLSSDDMKSPISNNMFFVYVTADNAPAPVPRGKPEPDWEYWPWAE